MMKRFLTTFLTIAFLLAGVSVFAQITEKPEFGKFAITGGTIHTVTNGVIENGVVLIEGEKITFVGNNARIDGSYKRIDATGKHVYPGMIDSDTGLGLVEIGAVPVTVDNRELGNFKPEMMAFTAINPNSAAIPVTRVNAVTTVLSQPAGGIVAGKATLIDLWGYSPDSMALKATAGLSMGFPSSYKRGFFDQRDDKKVKEDFENALKQIDEYFAKASFYNTMKEEYEKNPSGKKRPDIDIALEAMREVIRGEIPVIVSVNRERDILEAIKWAQKHQKLRVIFTGVNEGWRVADKIAEAGIPVIVTTLYTPSRDYDNYQRPYQNPGLLHKAGVKVLIGSGEEENVRNLPYNAGYAAAYGLGKEEALKAVTINPAEVFGVADRLGSIEAGKQANIVIASGDLFEPLTNYEHIFIKGYKIPLMSRHTQLFEEFLDRDAVKN